MPKDKTALVTTHQTSITGVLKDIVATKREEVELLRLRSDELRDAARGAGPSRDFRGALTRPGEVRLLAEVKRRSPSAGEIRPGASPAAIAREYAAGGAAALSILTDERYFGGSLGALREVRDAVELPLLRKDFVISREQIWEARFAGADAVLLIVRILEDSLLADLHGEAVEVGLDVLVEIHDSGELERALRAGALIIGVNNRDLSTFTTDLGLSLRLAESVPAAATLVAESGIRDAGQVELLGAAGVDAVLVGESLMRQPDVRAAAAALVGHPKLQRVSR
ncbi:MAG: indole-3-glycerol phosphate synthase TrpC [Gemmatimonadetes bacterium]|nr:indole-3-glycerol phosphate synthase TrpC [Gemmatimonadota bacterium]